LTVNPKIKNTRTIIINNKSALSEDFALYLIIKYRLNTKTNKIMAFSMEEK
jgi:hypothetical protein